jgi:hypothetical protein
VQVSVCVIPHSAALALKTPARRHGPEISDHVRSILQADNYIVYLDYYFLHQTVVHIICIIKIITLIYELQLNPIVNYQFQKISLARFTGGSLITRGGGLVTSTSILVRLGFGLAWLDLVR